ncbi:putative metal binding protein [Mycoplasmopsis californica]|uniref:Endoribonuclease YbeY n=1 Tax=Mycoplasmopsis equigenitalium TaxID=114883 RepID=A0ABY5J0P7_9BACT|nr:rRNA maturation RNase YbeY [Mycoplasmopsis equigenitalium]UUD36837.1 rRNA maturation RNase YbeY [Mycoplasmopsis equigenitalium]VEU69867.1 putative metal binding protein [Mycoplasmopsis californica]
MKNEEIEINVSNNVDASEVFETDLQTITTLFREYFNLKNKIVVDVIIETPEEIHRLNKAYRQVDKTTDVLSFGLDALDLYKNLDILPLGEVYLNYDQVQKQAIEYNHSLRREFCYLYLHSLLHLYGYDHIEEDEAKEMNAIAETIMSRAGIERA